MKLRLLGPLELAAGRGLVSIGGPRQRVVLSVLAMNANRVTPIDLLIRALWGEAPPETARAQIQTSISSLRKLFGGKHGNPDAIQTRPPGYLLEVAPADLDSQRFTDLVAEARAEADRGKLADAAATLRTALALWRGPMLSDIESDLVQREAASFAASKITAIEKRIRLDLALGWHEAICGELAALVKEYPLNERFSEFWMLALYRCGRQADALEVARRTRSVLVAELGIEPGHDLQKLETAILNRDPSLDLQRPGSAAVAVRTESAPVQAPPRTAPEVVPVPRQLPPSVADFTGRVAHIEAIKQALAEENLDEYAMRIVAISGKGGVGKSSLAVRVAHELGELFPDGQLYGDLANPSGDDSTATLLARFLRALGVEGASVPDDPQERAELYRSTLADKRVLVVLDDVTSEDQVLPLLPGSGTCAVITTSRMRLSGLFGARWLAIDVLDAETSMALLAKIIGSARVRAEQDVARELVRICGGLPLALRIAGARLASRPHWRIAALVARLQDEAGRLDEFTYRGFGLRFNIDLTYRSLAPRAKRLFRLFVLVRAPDLPAWTAAALLDTDLDDAEEVLERLVDAQLLDAVEYPGEQLRYRVHSLIRIYAMERLVEAEPMPERNRALQRVLGAWLALAESAHRDEHGGDYAVLHGTAPRWYPPHGARIAVENLMDWWDSERTALVAAVRHAAEAGLDELCWDLALTSAPLFEVKGCYDNWRETAMLGLEVTERTGNRLGHAAMLYSMGTLHLAQKRLPDAENCFAEALDRFTAEGSDHGRALVLRKSALIDGMHGDPDAMLAKNRESLALMRAVGDRMGEAQVLRCIATVLRDEGDTDSACELLDESLAICREVGSLRGEAQVLYQYASLRMETGNFASARRELVRVHDIVNQVGDGVGEACALYGLGVARYREGDTAGAEVTAQQALELAQSTGERLIEGQVLYLLGEVGFGRADVTSSAAYLSDAAILFEELGSALWVAKTLILQSAVSVASGHVGAAAEQAGRALDLLRGLKSSEAARLLAELDGAHAGMLADCGADSH
jgi:DNA-binding SARP family transcriptional activator/tetratricopeptide (TPR) repeat protein